MGMTTKFHAVSSLLENRNVNTNKRTRKAMREGAYNILDLAKRQVPVEFGNLEEAIKLKEMRGGLHNRIRVMVYVDDSVDVPGRPGKIVGDYSGFINWGDYLLGPESEQKQAENPDIVVGPLFMERAVEIMGPDIFEAIKQAAGEP